MNTNNSGPRPFNKEKEKVSQPIPFHEKRDIGQIWYDTHKYDNPIDAYYKNLMEV